jgi:hypothetical protein
MENREIREIMFGGGLQVVLKSDMSNRFSDKTKEDANVSRV